MPVNFSFRAEWLTDPANISWRAALALVSVCKASYSPAHSITALASNQWGMVAEPFEVAASQGVILEDGNVLVVGFRGTDSTADWLGNLNIAPRNAPNLGGSLHDGFLDAYDLVAPIVANAVARADGRALWFTGHSLGGALAVIAALTHRDREIAGLVTFGQPRLLGRRPARLAADRFGVLYRRFVNREDIVPQVPPGYRHTGVLTHFAGLGTESIVPLDDATHDPSAESLTGDTAVEPQMEEEEFADLQRRIREIRREVDAAKAGAEESGVESAGAAIESSDMLDASVEGMIPGVSAHRIDAYLAEVNARASAEIAMHGMHETFAARRAAQFSLEAAVAEEPVGADAFGVDDGVDGVESIAGALPEVGAAPEGQTYLVRLAAPVWTPPPAVSLRSLVGNIASISAAPDDARRLAGDPMVLSVEASRDAGVEDVTASVPHVRGTAVHTRPNLPEGGDAALVGIIDTGIDILHEAFNDAAGNSRIVAVWIQADDSGRSPHEVDPEAFTQDYGSLYVAEDIARLRRQNGESGAALPPRLRDELSGHGTHVASIAAGRRFADVGDGMAPKAGLVVVAAHNARDPDNPAEPRSIGYSASHVDALAFLKRVSLGGTKVLDASRPMAINVSLGMNAGAHDGQTTLEAAFDNITGGGRDPGLVIVKSAGNERGHGGHASVQAAVGAEVDIVWDSDSTPRRQDYLEAWFEPGDDVQFTLVTPTMEEVGPVNFEMPFAEKNADGNHYRLALSEGHSDNGHNRLAIWIERQGSDILPGTWQLRLLGRQMFSREAMVHIWAERVRRRSIRFQIPDQKMTLSVPGTARSIVTVGACNSAFPMRLLNMSSLGLTRDGRPKPELCAPGENIVAAAAAGETDAAIRKSGTSMAAPHVTGAIALAFSAIAKAGGRQVNAVQIQQRLRLTTQNFSPIHNPGFGSGILDAGKFFDEILG